jgi:hypothetical protein
LEKRRVFQSVDGSTPVAGNAAAIRDLCRRRDDAGIAITHVTAYWVAPSLSLPDYLPVIEAAAGLGAGTIVVNCGDPIEDRFVAFLAAIARPPRGTRLKRPNSCPTATRNRWRRRCHGGRRSQPG